MFPWTQVIRKVRLRYMLDHSGAAVLITEQSLALGYASFGGKRILSIAISPV
jgi:hypothetical protein